jgi:hypothetical protein
MELPNPKYFIPAVVLMLMLIVVASCRAEYTNEAIADAIYLAEGGKRAIVPYGILSVKVKDEAEARRVCINTIRNHKKRHANHSCGLDFIACLGNRYCPPTAHALNKHWVKNVKLLLKGEGR